ncbi:MAG: hypothetical protein PHH77_11885 [Victivallaceae bacterium]|nr:hypothetical protein [Victivallaceae bacterium]
MIVTAEHKNTLLRKFWNISPRQAEVSAVLTKYRISGIAPAGT